MDWLYTFKCKLYMSHSQETEINYYILKTIQHLVLKGMNNEVECRNGMQLFLKFPHSKELCLLSCINGTLSLKC